jgi:hypothetical protein
LGTAIRNEIKARTDELVVLVINENGLSHAMLDNSYWVTQNDMINAHDEAEAEFENRGF